MFFKKRDKKTWDAISRASLMGTNMVASTLVGLALGYYLDVWLGTSPWMLLLWLILGVVSGFRSMYLETMKIHKLQENSPAQGEPEAKGLGAPRVAAAPGAAQNKPGADEKERQRDA